MAEKTRCEECNRNFPNEDALAMHNSAKHSSPITEKRGLSKKSIIILISLVAVLIITFWFVYNPSEKNIAGNVINDNTNKQINQENSNPSAKNEIQKINLGFKDYNYYPNTIKVNANQPVEITLDSSVRGCFRNFNIRSLGISEYSSAPSQTIIFTPDKKGSFEFACGMRMAYGTIIVE